MACMAASDDNNGVQIYATSENNGGDYLYLRRDGNKLGRVDIDLLDLRESIPEPTPDTGPVNIRLDPHDNPFSESDGHEEQDIDDEISRNYGQRYIDDERYWVYVLECRSTERDFSALERRAEKRLGEVPDWLRMAYEARTQLYVGQTEDLFKRLGEHFHQGRKTNFTELFKPSGIRFIRPAHSRSHAERKEESIGKSYYDDDGIFAYWR